MEKKPADDASVTETMSTTSSSTSIASMVSNDANKIARRVHRAWTINHLKASPRHVPSLLRVRSLSDGDVRLPGELFVYSV